MGCFSFKCTECGEAVNSDSFKGENVRLSLLENGKVIEEMQGQYDSYGRVFDKDGESIEWNRAWTDGDEKEGDERANVCDLMFDDDRSNGIHAIHVKCITDTEKPKTRSHGDPEQGWGTKKRKHMFKKLKIYHKVY